jgi:hypothetical protein
MKSSIQIFIYSTRSRRPPGDKIINCSISHNLKLQKAPFIKQMFIKECHFSSKFQCYITFSSSSLILWQYKLDCFPWYAFFRVIVRNGPIRPKPTRGIPIKCVAPVFTHKHKNIPKLVCEKKSFVK